MKVLVTGAGGCLGRAVVARLRADGHEVRGFVRRAPAATDVVGDLGDPAAVERAVAGVDVVIHAGAATKGAWPQHERATVRGTEHVLAACAQHGVKQLVHISSLSVIDWAGSAARGPVDERAQLEPRAEERGAYTRAKLAAERLVTASTLPRVILRPGQIFGGGLPLVTGAVARRVAGRWIVLGDGRLELPLVYLDDVVDAIALAMAKRLTGGEIIQLIDPAHLTQRDVLALAGGPIVTVPRALVFALGRLSELPLGRRSPVTAYRLRSALARLHFESDRATTLLGWQPRVGVRDGIKRVT